MRVSDYLSPPVQQPVRQPVWEQMMQLQQQATALQTAITEAHQLYRVTQDQDLLDRQRQLSQSLHRTLQQMCHLSGAKPN